jgi:5-formyltetrahydrofolate cyclo-ligase
LVFFEKGIGTCREAYKLAPVKQNVLAPGVAFTRNGGRLGRGDGFLDLFLSNRASPALKIGVCFNIQVVDSLDLEARDVNVDAVVTD